MPQGLGRNLYPTLSVFENIDFFGRLFGQGAAERNARIDELLHATGLDPILDGRGKLSGGMKQKAQPLLLADPRSRSSDPRRTDDRGRSAVAPAVLGADRPHPRGGRR